MVKQLEAVSEEVLTDDVAEKVDINVIKEVDNVNEDKEIKEENVKELDIKEEKEKDHIEVQEEKEKEKDTENIQESKVKDIKHIIEEKIKDTENIQGSKVKDIKYFIEEKEKDTENNQGSKVKDIKYIIEERSSRESKEIKEVKEAGIVKAQAKAYETRISYEEKDQEEQVDIVNNSPPDMIQIPGYSPTEEENKRVNSPIAIVTTSCIENNSEPLNTVDPTLYESSPSFDIEPKVPSSPVLTTSERKTSLTRSASAVSSDEKIVKKQSIPAYARPTKSTEMRNIFQKIQSGSASISRLDNQIDLISNRRSSSASDMNRPKRSNSLLSPDRKSDFFTESHRSRRSSPISNAHRDTGSLKRDSSPESQKSRTLSPPPASTKGDSSPEIQRSRKDTPSPPRRLVHQTSSPTLSPTSSMVSDSAFVNLRPLYQRPIRTSLHPFEKFDPLHGDVHLFMEMLEEKFLINDIAEGSKKRSILLGHLNQQVYTRLRHLFYPEQIATKTYSELRGKMLTHYGDTKNEMAERDRFYSRKQLEGERLKDFFDDLRNIAGRCKFDNIIYENVIRDKCITGVRSKALKARLYQLDRSIRYDKIIEMSLSDESMLKPWERIHVDFTEYKGNCYFLVVDEFSKWYEVHPMLRMTAGKTISVLQYLFSVHGFPEQLISDNGPQFTAQEFVDFLRGNGVEHCKVPTYQLTLNSEIKRMVKTFRNAMIKMENRGLSWSQMVSTFLITHRNTPHTITGMTPAELLLGRQPRTPNLDKIKVRPNLMYMDD